MINPINVNAQGVGNSYGHDAKPKSEEKKAKQPEVQVSEQKKAVPADDVLSFMAQSSVSIAPASSKNIDPAKYVDKESEARIAGFMADFEDIVAKNLSAINAEFPEMTDGAKQALALSQIKA